MHAPDITRASAATPARAKTYAPLVVPVVAAAFIVLVAAGFAAQPAASQREAGQATKPHKAAIWSSDAEYSTADPDSTGVISQAQRHVDVLTGPDMHGRGYELEGHIKAAAYIESQFRRMGLSPVDGRYRQPFRMPTTLFLEAPVLHVNGRALELGTEFLPGEIGTGGKSRSPLPIFHLEQPIVDNPSEMYGATDGVVILEDRDPEGLSKALSAANTRAAIVLVDALYLAPRPPLVSKPVFYVRRSAWPSDARTVTFDVDPRRRVVRTQNVMARIEGSEPDSTLLLMAHYDHLGSLGRKHFFAGANDNASGVAMLLSLAEYFAHHQPRYSMVFVAFSGEEDGLRGSRYFRRNAPIDLNRVAFLLNFDMVASGEDGVTALGGSRFTTAYQLLEDVNRRLRLGGLSSRDVAPNSDHFPFMEAGIPGFFLYTKDGTQPYHHVHDVPETLEWHDFWHVYALSRQFIHAYMHRS